MIGCNVSEFRASWFNFVSVWMGLGAQLYVANIVLGMSVRVYLDEINIEISGL